MNFVFRKYEQKWMARWLESNYICDSRIFWDASNFEIQLQDAFQSGNQRSRSNFFPQLRKIQWCEALSSISRSRWALRANLKVSTFHMTLTMCCGQRLVISLHIWESARQWFRLIFEASDSANMSWNDRGVELHELIWPVSVRSLKSWISCSKRLVQGENSMQRVIFLAAA